MNVTQATQGNGFAALEIPVEGGFIQAGVDDLGLTGLVDLCAEFAVFRDTACGHSCTHTARRWFTTQDEAATWLTSQVFAAIK